MYLLKGLYVRHIFLPCYNNSNAMNFVIQGHVKNRMLLGAVIVILVNACSPGTQITGSWKSKSQPDNRISKVLVTAMTSKVNAREQVEGDIAAALENKGYKAVKSIDVMPPNFTASKDLDKQALLGKVKGTGVDAILTIALIDKETENRYVPGAYSYQPFPRFGYYGQFWGYYNTRYPQLYSPGYYTEDKVYFIETNLYDARTEALLWSAQSETYNPSNLQKFSKEFSTVVLAQLERDHVLKQNPPKAKSTPKNITQ